MSITFFKLKNINNNKTVFSLIGALGLKQGGQQNVPFAQNRQAKCTKTCTGPLILMSRNPLKGSFFSKKCFQELYLMVDLLVKTKCNAHQEEELATLTFSIRENTV